MNKWISFISNIFTKRPRTDLNNGSDDVKGEKNTWDSAEYIEGSDKDFTVIITKECKIMDFYMEVIKKNMFKLTDSQLDILISFYTRWIDEQNDIFTDRKFLSQTIHIISCKDSVFSVAITQDRLIVDERKKIDEKNIEETQIKIEKGINYTISRWSHINGSTFNNRFYSFGLGKSNNIPYMEEKDAKEELKKMLEDLVQSQYGKEYVDLVHELISFIEKRYQDNNKDVSIDNSYTQRNI